MNIFTQIKQLIKSIDYNATALKDCCLSVYNHPIGLTKQSIKLNCCSAEKESWLVEMKSGCVKTKTGDVEIKTGPRKVEICSKKILHIAREKLKIPFYFFLRTIAGNHHSKKVEDLSTKRKCLATVYVYRFTKRLQRRIHRAVKILFIFLYRLLPLLIVKSVPPFNRCNLLSTITFLRIACKRLFLYRPP